MTTNLAKIFVFTRDEYDLIGDFLSYHGALFGYENIVVVDNNSTHPSVLRTYDAFRKLGCEIVQDARNMNHFPRILTENMLRHRGTARFLIPLDTDEFIFHKDPGGDVRQSLSSIDDTQMSIIRFQEVYESVADPDHVGYVKHKHTRPAREITRFKVQGWDKVFFSSHYFRAVSHGNHDGITTGGSRLLSPNLCLLHFHNTGRRRQLERCLVSIRGYVHLNMSHVDTMTTRMDHMESVLREAEATLRGVGLVGGHRIEHFYAIMTRRWVVQVFHGVTGKYPSIQYVNKILSGIDGKRSSFVDLKIHIENAPKDAGRDFFSTTKIQDHDDIVDDIVLVEEIHGGPPPAHIVNFTSVRDALLSLSTPHD